MHANENIKVVVVGPEEAELGAAEFWVGGELLGYTRVDDDGEFVLVIEPRRDGGPTVVSVPSLQRALARAQELLASY